MVITGFFLIGFGILIFYATSKATQKPSQIKETQKTPYGIEAVQTFKIKDIINLCNIVKEEMETSGYFNLMVAIEGTIKSDYFFEGKLCYIEKIDPLIKNTKSIRVYLDSFYVEDDTGQILVLVDKQSSFYDNKGRLLTKQDTIPHNTIPQPIYGPIYVVGEASDASGQLVIKRSKDPNNYFVIAFSSKKRFFSPARYEELISPTGYVISGISLIFLGLILIVAGLSG